MVALRKLRMEDASIMLEWMHDWNVTRYLRRNFDSMTIKDCEDFIKKSWEDNHNMHLAIADNDDKYIGTASLKHITSDSAEFAIVMSRCGMGKGYAIEGMRQILEKGFKELELKNIYWSVSNDNLRAIRFYDKNRYKKISIDELCDDLSIYIGDLATRGGYSLKETKNYIWYLASREADNMERQM